MTIIDFNLNDVSDELRRGIKRLALENRYTEFCIVISRCNMQIDAHSDIFEILKNYVKYKVDFDVLYHDELTYMANEICNMYRQLRVVMLKDFKEFYELNRDFYQDELGLYLFRENAMQAKYGPSFLHAL